MSPSSREDFEVFDQPDLVESSEAVPKRLVSAQVSTKQKAINIPEAIVLQRRTPNILALLESHAKSATLEVSMDLKPLTPHPSRAFLIKLGEKKRKRDKRPGKEVSKEGEIPPTTE